MATPASTGEGAGALRVAVITPEATVFEGEADQVVAPAWNGSLGILRGHAPLMALLGTGTLKIKRGAGAAFRGGSGGGHQPPASSLRPFSMAPSMLPTM